MAKKNTDTVPAMLTPGEVVLNAKQQKKLGKLVGQPSSKVFGKIGVPGFQAGGIANTPVFKRKVTKENPNLRTMRKIIKMAGGGRVGKPKRSDIYRGIYLAKMRNR